MNITKNTFSFILLLVLSHGYSQKSKLAIADKQYEKFSYIDAISTYEKVASKGYKDEKMFQRLGNAYYFNAELPKAEQWYTALFEMNSDQEAEYYYRYSQSLKSVENYKKADEILNLFYKKSGSDQRAKLFLSDKDYLDQIKENSNRFTVEDAGINSVYSDYGSSFWNKKLVFASARDTIGYSRSVAKWTNQSFTNLYTTSLDDNLDTKGVERLGSKINSKYHESTPVFTKDGQTMYFTRNNYLRGKRGKDDQAITLLKLYKASLVEGKWSNVRELPFNSDTYSVAHPALSADESELYFASNMAGTLGQSDLYKVKINGPHSYSSVINLGSSINTEGRETFPFISSDNELYFASDGRPGLGVLDIFVTKINQDSSFEDIQNVGSPINSSQDDFGFLIDSYSRVGFFSSNREGGHGYDDIYKFKELKKLECVQSLNGYITDQETQEVLANARLTLFDENQKNLLTTVSDSKGYYSFQVLCGKKYFVRAEKLEYETNEGSIAIAKKTGESNLSLALNKRIRRIAVGTDLAKALEIPIIYFDLDKSFIRKDASFELEKVLAVMTANPTMKVDIRSHTDSRQTSKYNESLSERRASSTRQWLIKNGIAPERLTSKGYGETQLINKCADGIECTEEEHQLNRRSEFIIVSMD